MKVGDYVRTKSGEIGKLVNVEVYYVLGQNDKDKFSCVLFNNSYVPCIVSNDFIIKKGQLIDLIEVGDYVNGNYVLDFETLRIKEKAVIVDGLVTYGWGQGVVPASEIKSIVTKEQFKSMEYRIEE